MTSRRTILRSAVGSSSLLLAGCSNLRGTEENGTTKTSHGTVTEPASTTEGETARETTTIWWERTRQGTVQPDAEDLAVYNHTADERYMTIVVAPISD